MDLDRLHRKLNEIFSSETEIPNIRILVIGVEDLPNTMKVA